MIFPTYLHLQTITKIIMADPWEDDSIGDDEINALFDSEAYKELTQSTCSSAQPSQMYQFRPTQPLRFQACQTSQTSTTPTYRIPGPAGIIQEAMFRKAKQPEKSTQEYIRDIIEHHEEDPGFKLSPWLSAMEFAYPHGGHSNLGNFKDEWVRGKLHKVVGLIKSCEPNIVGDLRCMLKDTTGEMSGTIDYKILDEVKGICVGCVLVIHHVTVIGGFRFGGPYALNITKRNLAKVFYKDGTSTQNLLAE